MSNLVAYVHSNITCIEQIEPMVLGTRQWSTSKVAHTQNVPYLCVMDREDSANLYTR